MRKRTNESTPFLPNFPRIQPGRKRLSEISKFKRHQEKSNRSSFKEFRQIFTEFLSTELFTSSANSRNRIFNAELTFWAFLNQVLTGLSCAGIVKRVQNWHINKMKPIPSSNTSAYCQAKKRLPVSLLRSFSKSIIEKSDQLIQQPDLWWGKEVKIVDGTGFSMPDTKENQETYPQNKAIKAGCGFPQMSAVGLFSLTTGLMLDYKTGNKHDSEKTQWRGFWDQLNDGEIILADRGFCSYPNLAFLKLEKDVDCVMRFGQRKIDYSQCKKIGKNQWLSTWKKPRQKPHTWSQDQWDKIPLKFTLRIIKVKEYTQGFRSNDIYLVTTLIDKRIYKADKIEDLYMKRWAIEVFFRDAKISLGMDILKSKSPELIEKEVLMFVIAYNLVRSMIAKSAKIKKISFYKVSFKGAIQQLILWWDTLAAMRHHKRPQLMRIFYEKITDCLLIIRPGRSEPRALKRRTKNYNLLTKPRSLMIIDHHRNQPTRKNALFTP
jgi:hypothetical protein